MRLVKKDTPDQVMAVLSAAAAFAAIATIFGSPVIGAIILIEAAGIGGPMLPLILLPGLMSAGIGSVIFIGMGKWTGLSSSDYALSPFTLPAFSDLTVADFLLGHRARGRRRGGHLRHHRARTLVGPGGR